MINKNNKNVQITLDHDSFTLLDSLAVRYNTTKSIIIKNALKVYAAKKEHLLKIKYSALQEAEQTELKSSSEKSIKPMTPEQEKQWDQFLKDLDQIK